MKLKDGQIVTGAIIKRMMVYQQALKLKDEDYPGLPDILIEESTLTRCVLKPSVTSYRIPEEVTHVTMDAFWSYSSPITEDTDYYSLLETLYIPKNVSFITPSALNGLLFLSEIIVDEDNPYFRSIDGILYTKDGKKLVSCPPGKANEVLKIPSGTEVIGENSFENSLAVRVEVPETLKEIEDDAFWYSYSRQLDLTAAEIKSFGKRIFDDVADMTIYAGKNRISKHLFDEDSVYEIVYPEKGKKNDK